jgi:GT2 family glycosyltransferase
MEQANSGPSVARNNGSRAACGDLLVFIDDDIEAAPDLLQRHADAHQGDEDLVLIGPQSEPIGERFPVWIAWEHRMLERQYARFRSGEWEAGPNNLYSGNFSVRREHLIACGGFDPSFKRQEDVELGFRLERQGLHFRFDGDAVGYHRPERTFESWFKTPYLYGVRDIQMTRDKGQDMAIDLARKHYRERNKVTRMLAKTFIGGPLEGALLGSIRGLIPVLDGVGLRKVSLGFCSLAFNLRYLQGMAHEIGGARKMWNALALPAAEGHA